MTADFRIAVGKALRGFRRRKAMGMTAASAAGNVHKNTLRHYEHGRIAISYEKLAAILDVYGVPMAAFHDRVCAEMAKAGAAEK